MRTFSLHFYLKREKVRPDGQMPIYARITVAGKRAELALQRYIDPVDWDEKRGKPIGRQAAGREVSTFMESVRAKVYQHHREILDRGEVLTAAALKDVFVGKQARQKTLVEVFEHHNRKMRERVGKDYAAATLQRFETVLKHAKQFMKHEYKISDIALDRIEYRFIADFDHFLRAVRGIANNTTVKYMALFRKIILMALQNDWMSKDPFRNYKSRVKVIDREYLTGAELATLQTQNLHTERLDKVRDIFVFSCYTGLAYADVSKLTPDHLARGVDGEWWINVNRTKTDTKSLIPLLPPALEIIRKYKNHPETHARGLLLPLNTNQRMNAYLKEVAVLCGITKNLTFHMARHTFATTVTLSNGVPIESVSSMLGHTNIRTTQHYAKVLQQKVSQDMQALRGKLFGKEDKGKVRKLS